ncbi:MAG TPA: DUF3014 domain-containing protein [Gammaproteobacteria bacterium]|nr:DUF3014 domain-containing protein [Gammaproteobacteria bacterium]
MKKLALTLSVVVVVFSLFLAWLEFWPGEKSSIISKTPLTSDQDEPVASNLYQYDSSIPTDAVSPDTTNTPTPQKSPNSKSLPTLDLSDAEIGLAAAELVGQSYFSKLFVPKSLIRHFVVTIDNLPTAKVPYKRLFITPAKGAFLVTPINQNQFVIDSRNEERYSPYIQVINSIDLDKLVNLYIAYYPLFQQAYEELGYTNRQFHDRLISVMEHLLATPSVERPFSLTQPKVLYTFANEDLESLSAGQKLLLRIGDKNRQTVLKALEQAVALLRTFDSKNL